MLVTFSGAMVVGGQFGSGQLHFMHRGYVIRARGASGFAEPSAIRVELSEH